MAVPGHGVGVDCAWFMCGEDSVIRLRFQPIVGSTLWSKLLLDTRMRDALTFIQFAESLAHADDEVDALLNVVPRGIFGQLFNGVNRDFLGFHDENISRDSTPASLLPL